MKKHKIGALDIVLFFFTGGLWLFVILYKIISNFQNNNSALNKKFYVDFQEPEYDYENEKRPSKASNLFTRKWFDKACKEFVVLDLETTGLSKYNDRIIEIGAVRYVNKIETDVFSTLVNPEMEIPQSAVRIHGITNEMVKDAPTIDEALPDFLSRLDDTTLIVAHNASFDIGFLELWTNKLGYDKTFNYIDTLAVSRKLLPHLPNHKRATVVEALGCRQESEHSAVEDCRGCAAILLYALETIEKNNMISVKR